jgi:hypothetical protein
MGRHDGLAILIGVGLGDGCGGGDHQESENRGAEN